MKWLDKLKSMSPASGRKITEDGEVVNIADIHDKSTSEFGERKVAERSPLISLNGALPFSDFRDERVTENSATITDDGSEYKLSHTQANDFALMRTTQRGAYTPGNSSEVGIGVRLSKDQISGDGVCYWGYMETEQNDDRAILNGLVYGLDSNGFFIEVFKNSQSIHKTYSDNFNINSEDLDLTKGHIFQVDYTYYGYGLIIFQIQEGDTGDSRQNMKTLHAVKFPKQTSIGNTNLKIAGMIKSTSGTGAVDMFVGGRQYSIVGKFKSKRRITSARRESFSTTTSFLPILSFRKKSDFRQIPIELFGFNIISSNDAVIQVRYNPSLTGATFGNIPETKNSETALERDVSATAVDTSTGVKIYEQLIGGGAGADKNDLSGIEGLPIDLPDEGVITFAIKNLSGTGTATIVGQMEERW